MPSAYPWVAHTLVGICYKYLLSEFLLSDRLIIVLNFCRIILFFKPFLPSFHLLCLLDRSDIIHAPVEYKKNISPFVLSPDSVWPQTHKPRLLSCWKGWSKQDENLNRKNKSISNTEIGWLCLYLKCTRTWYCWHLFKIINWKMLTGGCRSIKLSYQHHIRWLTTTILAPGDWTSSSGFWWHPHIEISLWHSHREIYI